MVYPYTFLNSNKEFAQLHSLAKLLAQQARPGTTQDGSGNKDENYSFISANKSASIKTKGVPIKSSKLLCFDLPLFYSKSCKLKTFPAVISRVFIFVMKGPSPKALDVKWFPLGLMLPTSRRF